MKHLFKVFFTTILLGTCFSVLAPARTFIQHLTGNNVTGPTHLGGPVTLKYPERFSRRTSIKKSLSKGNLKKHQQKSGARIRTT